MDKPAILGGDRLVFQKIRACCTILPHDISVLQNEFNDLFNSGMITCFAKFMKKLEQQLCDVLTVKHALAVSSGSAGLDMLLLTLPKHSEVIVQSYTFPATVHAIAHAHLKPIFIDVERETCNLCLQDVKATITKNTSAILAVNVFGSPCRIEELEAIAKEHQLKLFFDSAAAIGAKYKGRCVGPFGHAEVFSLSGTKVVTAGEGGVITTNDDKLAQELECIRNYGYSKREKDCLYAGFNGKMSELSAIIALWSLGNLEYDLACRKKIAEIYYQGLQDISGIHFQQILTDCETNYCTFAVEIDAPAFGLDACTVLECLKEEGIETLRYFCPPMHKTRAYKEFNHLRLEQSEALSRRNLCLPMHAQLTVEQARAVCLALARIQAHAGAILQKRLELSAKEPIKQTKKLSHLPPAAPFYIPSQRRLVEKRVNGVKMRKSATQSSARAFQSV